MCRSRRRSAVRYDWLTHLTPVPCVGDPLLEEAAFIAAAVREGALTARQVTDLALARGDELGQPTYGHLTVHDARQCAGDLDLSPATRKLPLAGVPIMRTGVDVAWEAALIGAGAIVIADFDSELSDPETADRAIAAGAAAFAIIHSDAAVQPFHTHRFYVAQEAGILLARSSRDMAIAVDVRDGALSGDGSAGLCRRMIDSVGKGLGTLTIALHPGLAEFARHVQVYAGLDARVSVMSAAQALRDLSFDEFDVVLSTKQSNVAPGPMLAIPMVPQAVYVYGKNAAAVFRVGAELDGIVLTSPGI